MDPQTYLLFTNKLLGTLKQDKAAAIYSLLPLIDSKPAHLKGFYSHTLDNQEKLLRAGIEIFTQNKQNPAKTSYEFRRITEEKEYFMSQFAMSNQILGEKNAKITPEKLSAGLGILSHIYLDMFMRPVQFFLPHSQICSAQWGFFNSIDYLRYRSITEMPNFQRDFRKELAKSQVWSLKFKPRDFSYLVRKTLIRDKKFETGLDPYCISKAMVIRIGELGMPAVSYDCVDHPLRDYLAYIGVNKYLRIDMEMQYCKVLEKEIAYILSKLLKG